MDRSKQRDIASKGGKAAHQKGTAHEWTSEEEELHSFLQRDRDISEIVDTHLAAVQLPAGSHSWTFDGRTSAGTMLPAGRYTSYVSATDGLLTAAQSVSFSAIAFVIKANDKTPGRGQVITITAVSAESLAAAPRLSITQPGKTPWTVVMVRSATDTYRATLRLKSGSAAGTVSFEVLGQDVGGQLNRTTTSFPLH